MRHRFNTISGWIILIVLLMQLIPLDRSNPPPGPPSAIQEEVIGILKKKCFDCHSFETRWPRYAYIAPISWFIVHQVQTGRRALNFSLWRPDTDSAKTIAITSINKMLQSGEAPHHLCKMPHYDRGITGREYRILLNWSGKKEN
jgi:hypothetical protein